MVTAAHHAGARGDGRLTSAELGVAGAYLRRWHDRGWIRGEWLTEAQGVGGRILWDRWVGRIVPILHAETLNYDVRGQVERRRQLVELARALRVEPDALHFVWDGSTMLSAVSDEEAVLLLRVVARHSGGLAVMFSPPLLDD